MARRLKLTDCPNLHWISFRSQCGTWRTRILSRRCFGQLTGWFGFTLVSEVIVTIEIYSLRFRLGELAGIKFTENFTECGLLFNGKSMTSFWPSFQLWGLTVNWIRFSKIWYAKESQLNLHKVHPKVLEGNCDNPNFAIDTFPFILAWELWQIE